MVTPVGLDCVGCLQEALSPIAAISATITFNISNNDSILDNASNSTTIWEHLTGERAGLAFLLFAFSLITVLGNCLVIAAVVRERYLHTATNYFITSLALADCLVGLVVMPFSAIYEVLEKRWLFSLDWCDAWRSLDVLFSTASILNLCVISVDRYWAIRDPFSYPSKMTRRLAVGLIALVWLASSLVSFPAIFWWRAVRQNEPLPPDKCPFTVNLEYIVFSSTISFYLPLLVMVLVYWRIYREAALQTRSLRLGAKQIVFAPGQLEITLRMHRGGGAFGAATTTTTTTTTTTLGPTGTSTALTTARKLSAQNQLQFCRVSSTPENLGSMDDGSSSRGPPENNDQMRFSLDSRASSKQQQQLASYKNFSLSRKLVKFAKEKKAAKTLGIVMGVFIICWLPFFIVNLWSGFCASCIWGEEIISATVSWLGWINSGMNPVIYACWSRDFRRAFSRILCSCCPHKLEKRYRRSIRGKSRPKVRRDREVYNKRP